VKDKKKPVTLYMTSKVATQLSEEQKEKERKKMMARIEKEEARRIERLAKQEQTLAYRAKKKADLKEATDSDDLIKVHCEDLEEALKLRGVAKATIVTIEKTLTDQLHKLKGLSERYYKAKDGMGRMEKEIADTRKLLEEARAPTDPSILELKKARLKETYTKANETWGRMPKSIRKKTRDRSIKAWAKRLLGL